MRIWEFILMKRKKKNCLSEKELIEINEKVDLALLSFYIEGIILDLKDIEFIEERKYKNMRVFLLTEEGRQFAKDLDTIIRKYKGEFSKRI